MLKRFAVPAAVLLLVVACISVPATTAPSVVPVTGVPVEPPAPTVDPAWAPHLPDPSLTPGDVLPVTVSDICVAGYSSKVRNVPQSVKDQVYQEYGITSHAPNSYEVDHLVSLELGGSNSVRNLWPEPYTGDWNAHIKDRLEDKLHAMVCDGQIDLQSAQQEIATNWIAAYLKYVGQP